MSSRLETRLLPDFHPVRLVLARHLTNLTLTADCSRSHRPPAPLLRRAARTAGRCSRICGGRCRTGALRFPPAQRPVLRGIDRSSTSSARDPTSLRWTRHTQNASNRGPVISDITKSPWLRSWATWKMQPKRIPETFGKTQRVTTTMRLLQILEHGKKNVGNLHWEFPRSQSRDQQGVR